MKIIVWQHNDHGLKKIEEQEVDSYWSFDAGRDVIRSVSFMSPALIHIYLEREVTSEKATVPSFARRLFL